MTPRRFPDLRPCARPWRWAAALLTAVVGATLVLPPAAAAPVTVNFSGRVVGYSGLFNLEPGAPIGTPVSWEVSFDEIASTGQVPPPVVPPQSISGWMRIGTDEYALDTARLAGFSFGANGLNDVIFGFVGTGPDINGGVFEQMEFTLEPTIDAVLRPRVMFGLVEDTFTSYAFLELSGSGDIVQHAVPEPTSAALALLALGLVGGQALRRRRPAGRTRRLVAAGLLGLAAAGAQAAPLNTELLINGDAETGDTTGWTSTGIEAVSSAVAGTLGLPAGVAIGDWSFTGALGDPTSQGLFQAVALDALAAQIDASVLTYSFEALLQSRRVSPYTDTGTVTLRFVDGLGGTLSEQTFTDPQVFSDYHDWHVVQQAGLVPVGARGAEVVLDSWRPGGESTDAFFDNLSLQVSAVPEPGSALLGALGLAALWRLTARRGGRHG